MMITSEGNKPIATHNFEEEKQDTQQKVKKWANFYWDNTCGMPIFRIDPFFGQDTEC